MASVVTRGVTAVVAATAALVVTAGCGGKTTPAAHTVLPTSTSTTPAAPSAPSTPSTPSAATASASPRPGTVEVFPGRDSEHATAPAINVAASRVGEPGSATMTVHNTTATSKTIQNITYDRTRDTGTTSVPRDDCSGTTLQPGESCDVTVQHTASQPGPYTVDLTMTTPEGTVTIPLTGQAAGTSDTPTPGPTPGPTPSPTQAPTPEPTTPAPDDTESPAPEAPTGSPTADGT